MRKAYYLLIALTLILLSSNAFSATFVFDLDFATGVAPAGWVEGGTATWDFSSFYAETTTNNNDGWYSDFYAPIDQTVVSIKAKLARASLTYAYVGDSNGDHGVGSCTGHFPDGNGYALNLCNLASNSGLAKITVGPAYAANIVIPLDLDPAGATDFILRADRNLDGGWTLYKNGSVMGWYNDPSPITDFNASQFFTNDGTGTNKIDDFNFSFSDSATPIPSIVSPNGGETFTTTQGTIPIDFNVNYTGALIDFNVDLNYSASNSQGTGVVLVDKNNISGFGCAEYADNNNFACSYDWNSVSFPPGDFFMLIDLNGNFDSGATTFSIVDPKLNIHLIDENTETVLVGASITLDGNTQVTDAFGDVNFWLTDFPAAGTEYEITLSKASYDDRSIFWDLNNSTQVSLNTMLLPDSLGTNTEFKFFEPDQTTILSNAYILVRNFAKNDFITERKQTNASGEAIFNLDMSDANYYFSILASDNDEFDYNAVPLTVYRPRDEETGLVIDANWNLYLTGLGAAAYPNLDINSQVLSLYSNTLKQYIVDVVSDSNDPVYLSRSYELIILGDPVSEELQPYLVSAEVGTTILVVTQKDDGVIPTAYPGVTVQIYKSIPGFGRSLMEEVITDAKGESFVSLIAGDTYEFEVYVEGIIKTFNDTNNPEIKVTGDTIALVIGTTGIPSVVLDTYGFKVTRAPFSQQVSKLTSGNKIFTVVWNNESEVAASVTSFFEQNDVNYDIQTWTGTGNHTFTHTIPWADINIGVFKSIVLVTYDGNVYTYPYVYNVNLAFGGYYDPVEGLKSGLRSDLGCDANGLCVPLLGLALIICAGLIFFISLKIGVLGGQATAILFAILLTLFAYLSWVPLELIVVIWVAVFAFLINDRRSD